MTDKVSMFKFVRPLVAAGFAIHWLKAKSKAPAATEGWSTAPVATFEQLERSWFSDANVGVRLGSYSAVAGGYLHVIDLDIRVADKAGDALDKLAAMFPNFIQLPIVISGSGGASRHLYFITDRPFTSKKLAQSDTFQMVFDPNKNREVKKRDWEIELFGTGKQVAMPPSIHPDTGNAYKWHKSFDLDMLECGIGPFITASAIELLLSVSLPGIAEGEIRPVLDLTLQQAKDIIEDLPLDAWCEDRDGWFRVGMALHHEFNGSADAFVLWDEFSKQSEKYDEKNQLSTWGSFKGKSNPVRMATLLQAAKHERMLSGFEEANAFDEPKKTDNNLGTDHSAEEDFELSLGGTQPDDPKPLEWMRLLDITEDGSIKTTLHNLELIIENDVRTGPLARFNLFTQETVQRGQPGVKPQRAKASKPTRQLLGSTWVIKDAVNGGMWTDDKDGAVRSIIEAPKTQGGYSIKVSDRDLRHAIDNTARKNGFHPVREYFAKLKWDGVKRLETLFIRYLGAPDTAYTRSVARLTLVAAVTRAHEPGHKFDYALILEGMQGKRKSTFIEILAKGWFSELDGDFHDTKQMVELMQGAWIMEIPELTGFSRSDVRAIKAFISRRSDKVRLAYAKRAQQFERQGILIGSTNDKEYLRDDTGGRRFWPMACDLPDGKEIDTDSLLREIDQLWAEAYTVYQDMRIKQPYGTLPLTLTNKDALATAVQLQESRRVETAADAMAGQIESWLDQPVAQADFDTVSAPTRRNATCLLEIWVEALGNDKKNYNQQASQQLSAAVKKIPGWITKGDGSGKMTFSTFGKQRAIVRIGVLFPGSINIKTENLIG